MVLENINFLDIWVSSNIFSLHNLNFEFLMIFITYFADTITVILFSIIFFTYLLYKKKNKDAIFFLSVIILGQVLIQLFKSIFKRLRPVDQLIEVSGYAFPSGHTTMATIIAFSLFFIFKDKIRMNKYLFLLSLMLYPLIIAFSRIYLNVHWLSDVLFGFVFGLFIVGVVHITMNYNLFLKK
jgi:undecaprenyl-diphosphatase